MTNDILIKLLSSLDRESFNEFAFRLWQAENRQDSENYINVEKLGDETQTAFEQVMIKYNGLGKEYQYYNLILPFYEPLEIFIKNEHLKLSDSIYFNLLKKYKHRIFERMDNWNFTVDGDYTNPTIAFVSNISGFNEDFYQQFILPKLDHLIKKNRIEAFTKIGTCDSFVELSLSKTLETFKDFINSNRGVVISLNDGTPSVQQYTAEKYLTGGLLNKSADLLSPIYVHTITSNEILKEFENLLNDISKERELELFIKRYYKYIFGEKYDSIEPQVCLKFPELDINNKDRRLDIFLRNSIEKDWELLELKHIVKPVKFSQGIPMFTSRIYGAIEQLKNYGNILKQDNVKRKLAQAGIEYFVPELKLILSKKPDISQQHWRLLKSNNENGIKIITMDDIYAEVNMRYENQLSILHRNLEG